MSNVIKTQIWMDNEIRYFERDDDFYFHAKDVCNALGIDNNRNIVTKIKQKYGDLSVQEKYAQNSRNQMRKSNFIEESIVYCAVIGRSNKPIAVEFQRWMGKVIKTIRKTGSYTAQSELQKLAIEKRNQDLEIISLANKMFGNDQRLQAIAQEYLANMMSNDQKLIGATTRWQTVTEIMDDQYTKPVILKNRIKIGRYVAKKYREKYGEIKTTNKLVNGHNVPVNIYEEKYFEEILLWVAEKLF